MTHDLRLFLRDCTRRLRTGYRPERHYMRGPGPACAARLATR